MIGNDHIRPGAFDGGEDFQHRAAFVQPAVGGGGFHHAVFAAHVVGGKRGGEFSRAALMMSR